MFILEQNIRPGTYAKFSTNEREEIVNFIGTGRVPTVFPDELSAHETREIFGLAKRYNVVKLVKEY